MLARIQLGEVRREGLAVRIAVAWIACHGGGESAHAQATTDQPIVGSSGEGGLSCFLADCSLPRKIAIDPQLTVATDSNPQPIAAVHSASQDPAHTSYGMAESV